MRRRTQTNSPVHKIPPYAIVNSFLTHSDSDNPFEVSGLLHERLLQQAWYRR